MIIQISCDDGHKLDLKVADLLSKYNLPGIFFIPYTCARAEFGKDRLSDEQILDLHSKGFEIGGHTMTHPEDMKKLTEQQLCDEIVGCSVWLEKLIGVRPKHFCSPKGRYNDLVKEYVSMADFESLRTVDVLNTNLPEVGEPTIIKPTIHVYPNRKEYLGNNWLDVAKGQFRLAKQEDSFFHCWMHSWEVEKFNLWNDLENLFRYIKQYDN